MNRANAVTVGLVVKNNENTIRDTIMSLLHQDFPHERMNLVVVDGNSSDSTLNIIQNELSKSDLPFKILSESFGLGFARQLVVNDALGDFIIWVDGDMLLSKDFVSKQVNFMEKNPKVGIAKGTLALKSMGNTLGTLETFSRAAGKMVDYRSKKASSRVLGTSGCIYRTSAILQVGGFAKDLRGYGEDWDLEIRVRAAGWLLTTTDAKFLDYERQGLSWKALWSRYWRRGYDTHYFLHKNSGLIKHYKMFPPAAVLSGLLSAHKLFMITKKKIVFLLPFQYLFKMTAWYIGFFNGHIYSYEPKLQSG